MPQIIIADEMDLTLIGAQTILKDQPEFDVVSRVRNGNDLLEAVQHCQPDVILFNEHLDPFIDVLALVDQLKHSAPQARLIVLGSLADGLLVRDLLACGVVAYLYSGDDLKDCLVTAISTVLNNRPYLSPTANAEYLVAMQSPLRDWQLDNESRSVLRMLAWGMHVSDIAVQMGVPLRRIYWVRHKLRTRFGANTNEHLISMAVAQGFTYTDR